MRGLSFFLLAAGVCVFPLGSAWAQGSLPVPAAKPNSAKATADAAKVSPGRTRVATDYLLGVDDVLSVSVLDEPTLSVSSIKVDSSGKIRLPMVGSLLVSGKTIGQVKREITKVLSRELRRPDVTVTLLSARPAPIQRVVVSGLVGSPGLYELSRGWRVSEVLARAGGLSSRPDLLRGTLSRGRQAVQTLDLVAIARDSSSSANLVLQGGDTLNIVGTTIPIRVAGQVKSPSSYDVPIGSTLGDAIALSGSLAPRAAARKVTITRANGAVVPVDLGPGDPTALARSNALKLQAGDLILVPESSDRMAILGAVARPGYFDIETGATLRLSQALISVGGVTPRAALTRATLTRNNTEMPLDLFGLLVRGDQDANIPLQPDDIITISEGTGVAVYGAVKAPGTFPIEEGRAPLVSDVLTLAGGLSALESDSTIRLSRRAKPGEAATQPITLSFAAMPSRDILNTRVYDGDSLTVEALKPFTIQVTGQVKNAGPLEVKEGTTLVEAINRAGGPDDKALLTQVTVRRKDGTGEVVDVRDAITKGAPAPAVRLQDGDQIVVPENKRQVYVMEAVNRPGFVPIPEKDNLTVGDALTKAGGPRDQAKLNKLAIYRQGPQGPEEPVILDLRSGKTAVTALNTPLRAGDILYVPQGQRKISFFQTLLGPLNVFRLLNGF